MADTLTEAHHAAAEARARDADRLDETVLTRILSLYHGALARGQDDNRNTRGPLADHQTLTVPNQLHIPANFEEPDNQLRGIHRYLEAYSGESW
jgi:hypothetical protein